MADLPITNQYGDYYERQSAPPGLAHNPSRMGYGGTPSALALLVLGVLGALVLIRMGFRGFVIDLG